MEKSKKKNLVVFFAVVLLISISICVILEVKKHKNEDKYSGFGNELQYVYSAVELVHYCECSGIMIDSASIDELKSDAEWVFKAYANTDLDAQHTDVISKLTVLESYFGIDSNLNLSQELYERYRQDQELFVAYPIQNNTDYEIHPDDVVSNYFIWRSLSISDALSLNTSYCKSYPVENGLIKWFAETTGSPSEVEKKNESNRTAWITLLVNVPAITDCSGIRDVVEDEYTVVKSSFKEESTLYAAGTALNLHKLAESLELESDYRNCAQRLYHSLNSNDAFGFYAEDYSTITMMNGELAPFLAEYGTLGGSSYFSDNVNRWLKENAQKHQNPIHEIN